MKTYVLRRDIVHSDRPIHYSLDYEAELNEQQYQVATTFDGPLLVVAGAGSGKTRTLTYRVARMIESQIPPESILLLTFTRKAAQEMLQRASTLIDARCQRVAGGTFHAFANMQLRRHAQAIGFQPNFSILDQGDSQDVLQLLRDQLGLARKGQRFPQKQTVHAILSKAVNKSVSVTEIVERYYSHFIQHLEPLTQLSDAYIRYKAAHQMMDYDDLLVYFRHLLQQHDTIRERLSQHYQYIMVDEYQDTNKIQASIVKLLASSHNNVMAVGDEAQSIYSFRGANYQNIIEFSEQFPGTKVIKLEENYRSVQPILSLTNMVIQQAKDSFQKRLFTVKEGGEIPALVSTFNERQQSQFIAQRILELHEEGLPFSDLAVLFRSGFHSFNLELELNRHGIPFVKVGGLKFLDAAHIKDILAHLRVMVNPLDAVSWLRMLTLIGGIGPKTASNLIQTLEAEEAPFNYLAHYPKKAKYQMDVQRLGQTLQTVRPLPPAEQVRQLREYYSPILHSKFDDYPKREQDLEQLNVITEQFQDLETFLTEMTLEPPNRSVSDTIQTSQDDEDCLVLSTIHSAKGLEWHSVFVIWVAEGRFPSHYASEDEESLEEELRLLYVAMTRAMQHLYLSYPIYGSSKWGDFFSRPSRFIEGISQEYLEQWSLVEEHDERGWEY